ncbi:hypothetical protein MASR2M29_14910 [Spirochaetota bacterium]
MCPNHELLSAWLDDEIPSPWKENMARHIEGCKSCEAVVAKLMSVREAFAADAADLDAISDKAKNRTYEKLEYRLHKPFGSNRAIKRLYIPIPMAMAAILAIAVLGFALLASQRRNSELRMAVLMAQEASSLVSSGLGIETVIDFVSRQNGAVNININLPSDVFGSARGEPVIIKEADLKPGSRR